MVGKRQAHMKGEKKSQMRGKFAFVVGPVRPPIPPVSLANYVPTSRVHNRAAIFQISFVQYLQ